MDRYALSESFMDLFTENVVQMGFTAQDQGEAVDGIVTVIHQHLDVVEKTRSKDTVLRQSQVKEAAVSRERDMRSALRLP